LAAVVARILIMALVFLARLEALAAVAAVLIAGSRATLVVQELLVRAVPVAMEQ
jgi:hypothetical protein